MNINDMVAVKVTEEGMRILRDMLIVHRSDESILFSGEEMLQACYPEQPDGTRIFAFHELMRYFGNVMVPGNPKLPFEADFTNV